MKLTDEKKSRLEASLSKEADLKCKTDFWLTRLEMVPADIQDLILSLFERFPQEIKSFSDIQIEKEEAMAKNDWNAWKAIVEKEKKYLSNISKE